MVPGPREVELPGQTRCGGCGGASAASSTRPSDACGPWRGDASEPAGPSSCSCARGTRGFSRGGGDSVETCASWLSIPLSQKLVWTARPGRPTCPACASGLNRGGLSPLRRPATGGETSMIPNPGRPCQRSRPLVFGRFRWPWSGRDRVLQSRPLRERPGSPFEVFHNCGKKCGKASVFAPSRAPMPKQHGFSRGEG